MLRPTLYAPFFLAALAASPAASVRGAPRAAADSLGRFPAVAGRNLEGEQLALPGDFAGELNVVLVAFMREQQRDVDSWMPFLTDIADARRDVRIYELSTLGRRHRVMRPLIDGGMRRGIPDPAVRAATVTRYLDKAPFRRALRLGDEDRIYVLLVDRDGRVHWRAVGRFDAANGAELVRRIEQLRRPAGDAGPAGGMVDGHGTTNLPAANGIIHVIDTVLVPSSAVAALTP